VAACARVIHGDDLPCFGKTCRAMMMNSPEGSIREPTHRIGSRVTDLDAKQRNKSCPRYQKRNTRTLFSCSLCLMTLAFGSELRAFSTFSMMSVGM
jgi:hypothetical protein